MKKRCACGATFTVPEAEAAERLRCDKCIRAAVERITRQVNEVLTEPETKKKKEESDSSLDDN